MKERCWEPGGRTGLSLVAAFKTWQAKAWPWDTRWSELVSDPWLLLGKT